MNISATIITLNEETNLEGCLNSLDFVDDIVVVDSGSTDRTREICAAFPKVRFFERDWPGFGRQKNRAAKLAEHDWIFNIDADERISPQLRQAIMAADLTSGRCFQVARENYFGRTWIRHSGWYPDYNIRLYDRRYCAFNERDVHEAVECSSAPVTLAGNLVHYSYRDIADYLERMDRYATLAAQELLKTGRRASLFDLLLRPPSTFVKMFFLRRGVLDGYHGFLLAVLYAVYTFLKYAKVRELVERSTS